MRAERTITADGWCFTTGPETNKVKYGSINWANTVFFLCLGPSKEFPLLSNFALFEATVFIIFLTWFDNVEREMTRKTAHFV